MQLQYPPFGTIRLSLLCVTVSVGMACISTALLALFSTLAPFFRDMQWGWTVEVVNHIEASAIITPLQLLPFRLVNSRVQKTFLHRFIFGWKVYHGMAYRRWGSGMTRKRKVLFLGSFLITWVQ